MRQAVRATGAVAERVCTRVVGAAHADRACAARPVLVRPVRTVWLAVASTG